MEKHKEIIVIAVIAFFLRLMFLSPWLEDWDSVQFVLALNHYSIVEHLPHPPGYPLYIILGKIFNMFIYDGALALTIMSALLGSLTVFPLYFLAKKMFNKETAILSSLILVITPVHWIISEVALTNIPGQFFLNLLIYFMYVYRRSFKGIVIVSFLFGSMLGLRFTEAPIIISLLALILFDKKNFKLAILAIVSFLTGVLLWILPLIYVTGFDKFIKSFTFIATYILEHDSISLNSANTILLIQQRFLSYLNLLNISYSIPLLLTFLIGTTLILNLYLFSYVFVHLSIYNMEVTRYTLPILPPLAILTSFFIFSFFKKRFAIIFSIFLIVYIFSVSFSQLIRFKNSIPATISPILYTKDNFKPDEVIIISSVTFRQFQYYAKNYTVLNVDNIPPDFLFDKNTIIIDHIGTLEKYPALKKYALVKKMQFSVDRDIFPRVYQTTLYILKKANG